MSILYISALSSTKLINELFDYNKKDPGFAVQKFNRLLAKGIIENGETLKVLTAPPVGRHNSSKLFWHRNSEKESNIIYEYLHFINIPGLRQICLILETFVQTIFWCIRHNNSKNAIVCDVLNASISVAALVACKITKVQAIGVMTDMPGLMVRFEEDQTMPLTTRFATKIIKWCFKNYNKFVFLTESMDVVNEHNRPYIVMEGISDCTMTAYNKSFEKNEIRTIMYAGGLHERYGLKKLTEAFMKLPDNNIRLKLFGSGPFVKELQEKYCKEDHRIQYMGVVSNKEVIQAELQASLLVNPRPTNEDFTRYSFPSKNIEYMASGTPLLTTKLPGMPAEYYSYVFLIDDETIDGYTKALSDALAKTDNQLYDYGNKAKDFVIKKKNSYEQARRVLELIKL